MGQMEPTSPSAFSKSKERQIIFLLCILAALHVFIFSAAFPLNNNVDEFAQFDLTVKYAHGRVPRGPEPMSAESIQYIDIYGSQEFYWAPENYPGGKVPPPPWTQPAEKIMPTLVAREAWWRGVNYESSQEPLYYTLAGTWWHIGQGLGLEGGHLLYWLRFLDILFVGVLVWVGYAAARMIFLENIFLRLAIPALLAFMPQTAFYSINNDVLSPLCFGAAFVGLVKWRRLEIPGARMGTATGLALAAVFLTKLSNLPLLAVAFATVLLKIRRLAKSGTLRAARSSLASLLCCALLPMAAWLVWCKINFGDFTGTAAKIRFFGWTLKPFGEWWHHPIFTPHGIWIFLSGLLATFWQGEFCWHFRPLALPSIDMAYIALTFIFIGVALMNLLMKTKSTTQPQREALWLGFACLIAAIVFLGFLSIIYDFHDCHYPSRDHPYFTSGRLMLGALIPFMLLFAYGIDRALNQFRDWTKFSLLTGMILFMLVSEIATDWPVFSSQYNWFYM